MARVVVAAVDGDSGGRSGASAEKKRKEEEAEKKDVVPLVVHGQYPPAAKGEAKEAHGKVEEGETEKRGWKGERGEEGRGTIL